MLSGTQIRQISDDAAYKAAREDRMPLVLWREDEVTKAPFLGPYIPYGWKPATWDDIPVPAPKGSDWWHGTQATLFVDSTGFGGPGEAALSPLQAGRFMMQLASLDARTWGVGIVSAGEFQVYIGIYLKVEPPAFEAVEPNVAPEGYCHTCESSVFCYCETPDLYDDGNYGNEEYDW